MVSCGNQGGGTTNTVFLQLRLMSCNLEQQEAVDAQNPRWQTEEETSNQQCSFPENKGSRGSLCSKRPSQSSYDAFRSRKFKQAQQVDSIKRMANGFTGFSSRPEHLEACTLQ